MNNIKIKFSVLIAIIIPFLFLVYQDVMSQQRDLGEIIPQLINYTGQGTKWSCTYRALSSVRWDEDNYLTSDYYEDLSSPISIWKLFEISDPNQEAFQPTPPRNFRCTNAGQIGYHPHFSWSVPDEPGIAYKILCECIEEFL